MLALAREMLPVVVLDNTSCTLAVPLPRAAEVSSTVEFTVNTVVAALVMYSSCVPLAAVPPAVIKPLPTALPIELA